MGIPWIQTLSIDVLHSLADQYSKQRERYCNYETDDERYWHKEWSKQLGMVTRELQRRAA